MNRRSGLGKGLDSLIPTEVSSVGSQGGLLDIPVSAIVANEHQPRTRFDEEALVSLTDSVRELGVLQPILVREVEAGQYALIAGERRWRAARRAGLTTIPAIVREVDDQKSLEQAVVENLHREDLHAMEEASAYQRLIDEFSLTQEQVATRVGKSRSAISNTLRLFQLPGSVQRMVASGDLTAGHARAILGTSDRTFQQALAARVLDEKLNVRQAEEAVRTHLRELDGADEEPTSEPTPVPKGKSRGGAVGETRAAGMLELESLLGGHLDTGVQVALGKGKGRLMVEFADLEDLERIYRVMMEGRPA